MGRRTGWIGGMLGVALLTPALVSGQAWERAGVDRCEQNWGGRDSERFCTAMEATIESTGDLRIDGGLNGGVSIEGWNRDVVSVRAEIWASAPSMNEAEALATDVDLTARNGEIHAEGPRTGRRESWGVRWIVRVPARTDLEIETHNGGIDIADVDGQVDFEALNGGVRLEGLAGDVRGHTTNGGLRILLDGDRWDGRGMDVETTNGGIALVVPEGYSAALETGTTNGGIDLDFPVTVRGKVGRRLNTTLGEGGPTVRAITVNGGVKVTRSESAIRR